MVAVHFQHIFVANSIRFHQLATPVRAVNNEVLSLAANPTCKYGYRLVRGRLSVTNSKHDIGWRPTLVSIGQARGRRRVVLLLDIRMVQTS